MKIKYFTITFLCIIVYTFSFRYFAIDGFSIVKVAYTAIAWIVIILSGKYFIERFNIIKDNYGKVVTYLLVGLICWNVSLIIRSLFINPHDVITILGNEETALALLVPLVISFPVDKDNIRLFYSHIYKYLFLLLGIAITFVLFSAHLNNAIGIQALFAPLYFLIPLMLFFSSRGKLLVFVCSTLLMFLALYFTDSRSTGLKVILSYAVLFGGSYLALYQNKITYKLYALILIIPIAGIYFSIVSGQSVIKYGLDNYGYKEMSSDTRTFLYMELYKDLKEGDDLLIGRGANGKYYSSYFANTTEGDAAQRLTVEVGWLWLLLRGGFISVFIYSAIFFIAIYKAFNDSNNKYIKALGWILIIHYFVSFFENIIYLDIYNYFLWITVGIILNKNIRHLDDKELLP